MSILSPIDERIRREFMHSLHKELAYGMSSFSFTDLCIDQFLRSDRHACYVLSTHYGFAIEFGQPSVEGPSCPPQREKSPATASVSRSPFMQIGVMKGSGRRLPSYRPIH